MKIMQGEWIEAQGTVPVGVGKLAADAYERMEDGHWYARREDGTALVFKNTGVGAAAVGDTYGAATIIDKSTADKVCTGGWTSNARVAIEAPDVFQLMTPGGQLPGQDLYATYQNGNKLELWRYTAANNAGYFKCNALDPQFGCQPGYQKDASGNCVAIDRGGCKAGFHKDASGNCVADEGCPSGMVPDGKGGCMPQGGLKAAIANLPAWVPPTIIAAGVLGASGIMYWALRKRPAAHAMVHHRAHAPRRRRRR